MSDSSRTPPTDLVRALEAAFDSSSQVDLLCDLVSIPSIGGSERPVQERVAHELETMGLEIDLWEIDFEELAAHPAYACEVERHDGLGLVGTRRGTGGGPHLGFNSHVDVVPAGDELRWANPPYAGTVRDGRVWGRGALDAKGQLVCGIAAIAALDRAGIRLRGDLSIQSVIGEEDGGAGALATLLRGHLPDSAIVLEPTELTVCVAQAGCLDFVLEVEGLSAHGCLRQEGVSALEKLWPLHAALLELERELNAPPLPPPFDDHELPWPLSIGTVRAGNWPSSVPESLVCEGRFGIPVDADAADCRARFAHALAEAAREDPWLRDHAPRLTWTSCFLPARVEPDAPVVAALDRALAARSREAPRTGAPYGADMRLLAREGGIPTLMFGPGNIRMAHAVDECVEIEQLRQAGLTLALAAIEYCGLASGPA